MVVKVDALKVVVRQRPWVRRLGLIGAALVVAGLRCGLPLRVFVTVRLEAVHR